LCEDAWWGLRNDSRRLQYNWPRTERPANLHWNLWRQALTAILDIGRTRKLTNNIGEWLPTSKDSWQWWMVPDERLFHQEGAVWVEWKTVGDARLRLSSRSFSPGLIFATLPSSFQPVAIKRSSLSKQVKVTGRAVLQLESIPEAPSTLDGWLTHLNHTEPHDTWILDELEVSGSRAPPLT
jgi:hypothetical protein